jgi:hypothetical protein
MCTEWYTTIERMIKMTLHEYLQQTSDWEITVWDKDYDIETYFYKEDGKNAWDKAMNEFAKLLTITQFGNGGVIVNLADVIESKLPALKKSDLFIRCNIDAIMDDIDNILAGCVSEEWLTKFVEVLKGETK